MNNLSTKLILTNLQLKIKLGVTAKERLIKQKVLLNLAIAYQGFPKACCSDKITDTICYDELIKNIKQFCKLNQFSLIEHLTYELFKHIKKLTGSKNKVHLTITKFPPIVGLEKASFEIKE